MAKSKTGKSRGLTILYISLFSIALIITVFASTYYYFINNSNTQYEKDIRVIIDKITSANNSTEAFMKEKTINPELIKKDLPKKIDILLKCKENLQTINAPEKFKKNQEYLSIGLDNNILLYRQIFAMVNNPQDVDPEKLLSNLDQYREDCMNNYALTTLKNATITLSEKNLAFIDTAISYTHKNLQIKKANTVKENQYLDFISTVDSLSNKFIALKTDFSSKLLSVRNGDLTYDDLISLIDENRTSLYALKKEFLKVTPVKTILLNFSKAIESYDFYLQDFKYNVNTEKIQASNKTGKTSNSSSYSSSMEKLEDASKNYDAFMEVYTNFKNSIAK